MGGQYSVKETKEVLRFALAGYQAYKGAIEDGKIGFEDIGQLMVIVPYVGPAIQDVALIPKELVELDAADAKDLIDYAGSILPGVVEARLVQIINACLTGVVSFLQAYVLIKGENVQVVFPMPVVK